MENATDLKEDFYHRILYGLARQAKVHCRPNPAVAAAIFYRGRCVSFGATQPVGEKHAEIVAMDDLKKRVGLNRFGVIMADKSSTIFMATLSPCHFHGRTPPCSEALMREGLSKIAVAHDDIHPLVRKKSLQYFKNQQITVQDTFSVSLKKKFLWLNYDYLLQRSLTFTLKYAMTADGKMATKTRDAHWITGSGARRDARYERACHDAVLVGAGTLLADNPRLDIRDFDDRNFLDWSMVFRDAVIPPHFLDNFDNFSNANDDRDELLTDAGCFFQQKDYLSPFTKNIVAAPPKPFRKMVFFSRDIHPAEEKKLLDCQLLQKIQNPVLFLVSKHAVRLQKLLEKHFDLKLFDSSKNLVQDNGLYLETYPPEFLDQFSFRKKFIVDFCGRYDIETLFVEGGGRMLSLFFDAGLCDRLLVYLAPKILADGAHGLSPFFNEISEKSLMKQATSLQLLDVSCIDDDVKFCYVLKNAEFENISKLMTL